MEIPGYFQLLPSYIPYINAIHTVPVLPTHCSQGLYKTQQVFIIIEPTEQEWRQLEVLKETIFSCSPHLKAANDNICSVVFSYSLCWGKYHHHTDTFKQHLWQNWPVKNLPCADFTTAKHLVNRRLGPSLTSKGVFMMNRTRCICMKEIVIKTEKASE